MSLFTDIFSENDFPKIALYRYYEKISLIFLLGSPIYLESCVTAQVLVITGNHPKLYHLFVKRTRLRNGCE